ncbi:MAG: hypothetical protein AVDCRST_MAG57-2708, partial [uncultured Blastococcus sp.]
ARQRPSPRAGGRTDAAVLAADRPGVRRAGCVAAGRLRHGVAGGRPQRLSGARRAGGARGPRGSGLPPPGVVRTRPSCVGPDAVGGPVVVGLPGVLGPRRPAERVRRRGRSRSRPAADAAGTGTRAVPGRDGGDRRRGRTCPAAPAGRL